jgi:hypothetical protein
MEVHAWCKLGDCRDGISHFRYADQSLLTVLLVMEAFVVVSLSTGLQVDEPRCGVVLMRRFYQETPVDNRMGKIGTDISQ